MAHSKKLQFILNKLYELNPNKIELKLDRVQRLVNDLGNPHKKLKKVNLNISKREFGNLLSLDLSLNAQGLEYWNNKTSK